MAWRGGTWGRAVVSLGSRGRNLWGEPYKVDVETTRDRSEKKQRETKQGQKKEAICKAWTHGSKRSIGFNVVVDRSGRAGQLPALT